jgi:hypothetical protein
MSGHGINQKEIDDKTCIAIILTIDKDGIASSKEIEDFVNDNYHFNKYVHAAEYLDVFEKKGLLNLSELPAGRGGIAKLYEMPKSFEGFRRLFNFYHNINYAEELMKTNYFKKYLGEFRKYITYHLVRENFLKTNGLLLQSKNSDLLVNSYKDQYGGDYLLPLIDVCQKNSVENLYQHFYKGLHIPNEVMVKIMDSLLNPKEANNIIEWVKMSPSAMDYALNPTLIILPPKLIDAFRCNEFEFMEGDYNELLIELIRNFALKYSLNEPASLNYMIIKSLFINDIRNNLSPFVCC